jgi:MFS family permease
MASSNTSSKGFYGWINLAFIALLGIVGQLYMISFAYFLPFFVSDFGWNRGTASLAPTLNLITLGLCGPLAGLFIAKYGARRAILLGNIMGLLGFLLIYFQNYLWQLFLGFGLFIGLGGGFGGILSTTTVVNNWFVKKRAWALSIVFGAGGIGGMILGPTLMMFIGKVGWRYTCLIITGLILILAIILPGLLIRNKPEDLGQVPDGSDDSKPVAPGQAPPRTTYRTPVDFSASEALRTRCLWFLVSYFSLNMLTMGALMTHQVAYQLDIGIDAKTAALTLSVMAGVMTFAQFGVGFIANKFTMSSIVITAEIIKLIAMIILVSTKSLPFVFVYMIIFGISFGAGMIAMMNIFPNYFGASNYPKIMGTVRLFWSIIGGAGAPIAGYIREATGSYIPAFKAAIFIIILGIVCLCFAKPPVHPSLKESQPVG